MGFMWVKGHTQHAGCLNASAISSNFTCTLCIHNFLLRSLTKMQYPTLTVAAVMAVLLHSCGLTQTQEFTANNLEQPGAPDYCLEGPFHKETPSPESEEFDECLSWQNEACCTVEVPQIIDMHKAVGLYNYSWDLCGPLSQECETFIKVC